MLRKTAWCILPIFRIIIVFIHLAYSLLDLICDYVDIILQWYLSRINSVTSVEIKPRKCGCKKLQKSKSIESKDSTQCSELESHKQLGSADQNSQENAFGKSEEHSPISMYVDFSQISKDIKHRVEIEHFTSSASDILVARSDLPPLSTFQFYDLDFVFNEAKEVESFKGEEISFKLSGRKQNINTRLIFLQNDFPPQSSKGMLHDASLKRVKFASSPSEATKNLAAQSLGPKKQYLQSVKRSVQSLNESLKQSVYSLSENLNQSVQSSVYTENQSVRSSAETVARSSAEPEKKSFQSFLDIQTAEESVNQSVKSSGEPVQHSIHRRGVLCDIRRRNVLGYMRRGGVQRCFGGEPALCDIYGRNAASESTGRGRSRYCNISGPVLRQPVQCDIGGRDARFESTGRGRSRYIG